MHKLVLLRHGESIWNKENRFTGWTDVDLSEKGMQEARLAGKLLREGGYDFDVAYTSVLKRAIRTLWIVLDGMDLMWIPVHRSWRLNERHYGALQGLNKAETAQKYGDAQVKIWRRSYSIPPPTLDPGDARYPGRDRRYAQLTGGALPLAESLKDTVATIRDHIAEDPTATKLGEEPIQVAKEEAYTLVKEETVPPAAAPADAKAPSPAGKRVKTRYVTFNHAGTKYYLLLRAPSDRFPGDDSAFESLLAKFHFS